ncbi:MAG: cytochrome-c peroxidase [Alphaproteobacteria bacterium]
MKKTGVKMFRIILIGAAALGVLVGPVLPGLAGEPRIDEPILPIPQTVIVYKDKAEIGKKLFNDVRLSQKSTIACSSCHLLRDGGGDGRKVSIGLNGREGKLNAPTVFSAAYNIAQFWCGIAGIQVLKGKFPNLPVIAISGGWAELDPNDTIVAAQKIGTYAGVKKN